MKPKTTVLEVLDGENIHLNPFVAQLIHSLESAGVGIHYWSYSRAVFGRFDVVHIHWPERLYRARTPVRSMAKSLLLAIILLLWKVRRIPVMWTVHNLTPHGGLNLMEDLADKLLRKSVSATVYLNDYDQRVPGVHANTKRTVIKHGDYVDWMSKYPHQEITPYRVCLFGNLRPYKGIESLIRVAQELPECYSLVIAGQPHNTAYEKTLRDMAGRDHRIDLKCGFQTDAELVSIITSSSLTVLPYHDFYNSGAVFLSLSLNRPVLVPRNPSTKLLQDEFGSDWVALYSGELTPDDIQNAVRCRLEDHERSHPNFVSRKWPVLGRQYLAEMLDIQRKA